MDQFLLPLYMLQHILDSHTMFQNNSRISVLYTVLDIEIGDCSLNIGTLFVAYFLSIFS